MDFREPRVRGTPNPHASCLWPSRHGEQLPFPSPLADVLERRSQRTFAVPSLGALSTLLWHTARCEETSSSPLGFDLQLRPTPSAGAIHPIHILLEHPRDRAWARYDPKTHRLEFLAEPGALPGLRAIAAEYVAPGDGCLLFFVAELGMTAAKYENPESLVWRDAGVLQGSLALVAPRAGLSLCFLGLTGSAAAASLNEQGELHGVGVAIVGAPL
jgi:hypothetical protein